MLGSTQCLQLVAGPLSKVVYHGEDSLCAQLTQSRHILLQAAHARVILLQYGHHLLTHLWGTQGKCS